MKIYSEHEDNIKKFSGTPDWDYAMSMGRYDESFMVVPIIENGKVVNTLACARFDKKVYFRYENSETNKAFFQNIIYGKYTRYKTDANNTKTNTQKGIVCITKTISMWYPDNESNPNAGGHWETNYYTNCYNYLDYSSPGWEDNGGGGYDYGGGGGGGNNNPNNPNNQTPCEKTKNIVTDPKLKPKIDSLKQYSLTAVANEKGYQQDKAGNVTPATVNGAHHVDFIIGTNSLGGIHCHTLNGTHMFSPKDILTLLSFAGVQNQTLPIGSTVDNTGNAYLGMIAQSGSYFITFNGGSGDLPPPMTDAEEDAFELEMNETYKKNVKKLLKAEGKNISDDLSDIGLQKLFFSIIKEMGLEGKINLIKENNGNTSTIQQNPDGTIKAPLPC